MHGIYNHHVADAPSFADVYVELSVILAGVPLIAYNMDFDWRMLIQTSAHYRLPPVRTGARHCAMKQYAQYWGAWQIGRGGYRWQKLGEAARQQGVTVANAHDAVGDCQMTYALLRRMADG